MHSDFTLFLRKYPNGQEVYFYYAYDENDERRGPWTTKSQTKTAARNYCHKLIRNGALIPNRKKLLNFGEYANGFWERKSEYIVHQESRTDISDSYLATCKSILDHQIMPFFENVPLAKITAADINKWLLGFSNRTVIEDGKKAVKQYKNTYANSALRTFNTMMNEAVRRELISVNPCANVQHLKNDRKDIEIITVDEVRRLFPDNYQTVWGGKDVMYTANKLASLTGMRSGEILGLRGEYVFDKYILVCGQYGRFGYIPHTKTRENRNIPVLPEMMSLLQKLMERNGKGFVFSLDGGATPVSHNSLHKGLHQALKKIGIDDAEIKRRGLTLHGWRHFLNTELQRQGLTIQQVQSVTGHKSDRMTEWYSHPDARQLDAVVKAQAVIAGTDKPENSTPDNSNTQQDNFTGLQIVKSSNRKSA